VEEAFSSRLYLISPPQIPDPAAFASTLRRAVAAAPVAVFQLRLKDTGAALPPGRLTHPSAPEEDVLRAAEALLPICHEYETIFLVNDRPELAKRCGADGVHLGQEDGSVAAARAILGESAAIGVSCHASRHLAMVAGEEGADYVAFGAFYPTVSKTEAARQAYGTPTPELLHWWTTHTTVPCVAVGGVTPRNCAPLVEAGADFIAAITSVWQHEQGADAAVLEFHAAMEAAGRARSRLGS
jgi:thiamine-phosphate pyrophosphorylase